MCKVAAKRDHKSTLGKHGTMAASASPPRPTKRRRLEDKRRQLEDSQIVHEFSEPTSSAAAPNQDTKRSSEHKRRVRFDNSSKTNIHKIPRWTQTEYASAWYSSLDITLFKRQGLNDAAILRYLISNASTIEFLPQDASVYRGLERLLSPQVVSEVNCRRKLVVKCVMMEQALLRQSRLNSNGESPTESEEVLRLATVSGRCTEKAAIWARTVGSFV